MSYSLKTTSHFDREVKKLGKKYKSLKQDLLKLRNMLLENPKSGVPLGDSLYKIRISIASKNQGKSGGARVITYGCFDR